MKIYEDAMDLFDVLITDHALGQLESYIDYIQYVLLDDQAADAVAIDAAETLDRLRNLAGVLSLCKNEYLKFLGYHKKKKKNHRYVMLYRIEGNTAIVEAIYHQTQDYESNLLDEVWNS